MNVSNSSKRSFLENLNNIVYEDTFNWNEALFCSLDEDIVTFSSDEDPTIDVIDCRNTKLKVFKLVIFPQYMPMSLKDMCEEYAPIHFRNIINYLKNDKFHDNEMIYLITYILGLEMGFVCKQGYDTFEYIKAQCGFTSPLLCRTPDVNKLSTIKPYPIRWERNRFYAFRLYLVNKDNVFSTQSVLLSGIVNDNQLTLALQMDYESEEECTTFEMTLLVPRFINPCWLQGDHPHKRFNRIAEFCYLVGTNIFKPVYDLLT